ncbi:MAG: DNA polymerase III subunit delta [Lachnospiraceae bacterium]|nr:DNA polymerase III subunit delta [Lachnospiraceae bacterium]
MESVKDDIKNRSFSGVYLIYGEEPFLVNLNKKRLSDAVVPADDNMNRTVFSEKDANVKDIIALSDTLPFLSEKRLILIEDSGFFKKAPADVDSLTEYIKKIPEETVIVFSESEVDKRGKLYKAVEKNGKVVLCKEQTPDTLIKWMGGYLSERGKKMRRTTAAALIDRTGTGMYLLKNEMDKLVSYTGDREEILEEDVKNISVVNVRSSVFAMLDDITEGRQKKALGRYYELLMLREPAMKILVLISREFNRLLLAKEMSAEKRNYKEMAEVMKVPEFSVRKYVSAAGRLSRGQIMSAIKDCTKTDNDIKKGLISDRIGTELLIIKYSGRGAEIA